LPVDEIKIDRSFVRQLGSEANGGVIVRSTIELGHAMGLKVVAEGVENDTALRILRSMECDLAQGFLLSRPLPAHDFSAWLLDRSAALAAATRTAARCGRHPGRHVGR
jgi:EAL domain-containing protein (putative c-di-GMP-specific phosphodiesterase class I)